MTLISAFIAGCVGDRHFAPPYYTSARQIKAFYAGRNFIDRIFR